MVLLVIVIFGVFFLSLILEGGRGGLEIRGGYLFCRLVCVCCVCRFWF